MDVGEEMVQPLADIDLGQLAATHEGVDDGRVLGCIVVAAEEVVLASQCQRANAVLDEVVVYLVASVGDVARELADMPQQITQRLADRALGQDRVPLVQGPCLQSSDD